MRKIVTCLPSFFTLDDISQMTGVGYGAYAPLVRSEPPVQSTDPCVAEIEGFSGGYTQFFGSLDLYTVEGVVRITQVRAYINSPTVTFEGEEIPNPYVHASAASVFGFRCCPSTSGICLVATVNDESTIPARYRSLAGCPEHIRIPTGDLVAPYIQDEFAPPPLSYPQNISLPVVTGSRLPEYGGVGESIYCSDGTWTGSLPFTFAYQWYRGVTAIPGATSNTYSPAQADISGGVKCRVTVTDVNGLSSHVESAVVPVSDYDANAYVDERIAAGGVVGASGRSSAVNIVAKWKGNGIWQKLRFLFFTNSGSANADRINIKGRNLGTWGGTPTHAVGYVEGSVAGQAYLDTGFDVSEPGFQQDCSIGWYGITHTATDGTILAARSGTSFNAVEWDVDLGGLIAYANSGTTGDGVQTSWEYASTIGGRWIVGRSGDGATALTMARDLVSTYTAHTPSPANAGAWPGASTTFICMARRNAAGDGFEHFKDGRYAAFYGLRLIPDDNRHDFLNDIQTLHSALSGLTNQI
jgi:hypothetical protein